jgi:hypothetical protein
MRYLLFLLSLFFLSSCYRMPEEGEVSVIPMTNNPHLTGQPAGGMPGVEY